MCGYFCTGFIDFMLADKKRTDYRICFLLMILIKMIVSFSVILKMDEINKSGLSDQTKFRLSEITGIENYFYQEINQQKSYSKNLNKYVTIFDYIDKILIILSVTSSGISIISFASAIGVPTGIASACFTLIFSITTGIIKKLLNITRKKKKRHDEIIMLAKSKLNSIESLISQALNDLDISHEEFIIILNENDKYEKMKYNLRSENENKK